MKKPGKVFLEAFKNLFKKPSTIAYPASKREIQKSYGGMINFDQTKCIGCQLCVKNCPTSAVAIPKLADKLFGCKLNLANCIFCFQCVKVCPKKAMSVTDNFELASVDKSKLIVDLSPNNTPAPEIAPDVKSNVAQSNDANQNDVQS
jgi:formate hydrogenlyase subunit 6/NADH:ubiquinone oxidoreductase subunit I